MSSIPKYKSASLSSVSRGAVLSLIQTEAYLRYVAAPTKMPTYLDAQRTSRGALVFLVWLQIWLDWLRGVEYAAHPTRIRKPAIVNRHCRRMLGRKIPSVRSFNILFHLCGKNISRTQFLELMCVLMPLGRVSIYSMRFRGSVLQRRALLTCYDHGWWHAPLSDMGRVNGGVWYAHLRPH